MKNQISRTAHELIVSLAELYETLDCSIDYIEDELKEGDSKQPIFDFSTTALSKLKAIREKILN